MIKFNTNRGTYRLTALPNKKVVKTTTKNGVKQFHLKLPNGLKAKYDNLLKPKRIIESKPTIQGYRELQDLYKDGHFMKTERYKGDDAISKYLTKKHPTVLNFIRIHKLRISASIAGVDPCTNKSVIHNLVDSKSWWGTLAYVRTEVHFHGK